MESLLKGLSDENKFPLKKNNRKKRMDKILIKKGK
jgi:hypothetical protein